MIAGLKFFYRRKVMGTAEPPAPATRGEESDGPQPPPQAMAGPPPPPQMVMSTQPLHLIREDTIEEEEPAAHGVEKEEAKRMRIFPFSRWDLFRIRVFILRPNNLDLFGSSLKACRVQKKNYKHD